MGVTGGEDLIGTLDSRQGFEEILDDGGDGGAALGGPDTGAAVDIGRDGYGDVAHGFLHPGAIHPFCSIRDCAPKEANSLQPTDA